MSVTWSDNVAVTVLGGYLGAGKTTLVNDILRTGSPTPIAVIVNDFGSVSIDADLIDASATGLADGVINLANGCICCSAAGGMANALEQVRQLGVRPEHLVIEVSGVGDPWAVAQWGRTPGFSLATVLTVADAGQVCGWAADPRVGDTVVRQIQAADVVMLTHLDTTPAGVAEAARSWVRSTTDAPMIDPSNAARTVLSGSWRSSSGNAGSLSAVVDHVAHHSCTLAVGPQSRDELQRWLDQAPASVVRVKGHVAQCGTGSGLWAVQRMGQRVEIARSASSNAAQHIVVICAPSCDPGDVYQWVDSLPGAEVVSMHPAASR